MADEDVTDSAGDTTDNSSTDTAADTQDKQTTDAPQADDKSASTDGKTDVAPDWADDWRDKMAKDDAKLRKRLDRFQSPNDITKSWLALEQKLSSGDLKSSLPDDATDEQIAEYRKDNGIPEKPEGYLENLPDGLVIGEDDKDLVNSYITRVHGKNADPAVVAETIDWYYKLQEDGLAAQAESDKATKQDHDDTLRAEWGADYRGNLNAIASFLDTAPMADDGTSLRDLLEGSRLADGTPTGNHPTMMRWLAQMASEANPAGFITPGAGLSQLDSVSDEIKEIEKTMRTNRAAYNKDEKMQARYLQLIEARTKLSEKAA